MAFSEPSRREPAETCGHKCRPWAWLAGNLAHKLRGNTLGPGVRNQKSLNGPRGSASSMRFFHAENRDLT